MVAMTTMATLIISLKVNGSIDVTSGEESFFFWVQLDARRSDGLRQTE
jgi:hypothetical protein